MIAIIFVDKAVCFFFCCSLENLVVRLLKSNGQSDELMFIKIVLSLDKIRLYFLALNYLHTLFINCDLLGCSPVLFPFLFK